MLDYLHDNNINVFLPEPYLLILSPQKRNILIILIITVRFLIN